MRHIAEKRQAALKVLTCHFAFLSRVLAFMTAASASPNGMEMKVHERCNFFCKIHQIQNGIEDRRRYELFQATLNQFVNFLIKN